MLLTIQFDTGYQLDCRLYDNDFAHRWAQVVKSALTSTEVLQDHIYANLLNKSWILKLLQQSADTVNKFLQRPVVTIPVSLDSLDQEFFNRLHQEFELLSGPDWDRPTRLMTIAPDSVKRAIRDINRYCHVLENSAESEYMRIEFAHTFRHELQPQDYRLFTMPRSGTITIDYATLGKSLLECWQDGLTPEYPAMRFQKHFNCNFMLRGHQPEIDIAAIQQWADKHGSDIQIKPEHVGTIEVGEILDPDWFDSVKKTSKILNITLE